MKSTTPGSLAAPSAPFSSVFDSVFDVLVLGAGFTGCAAAHALAARGLKTLIVEPSGDLLWEATRALENTTAGTTPSPDWNRWLETLRARTGANADYFDPALAEILTAHELASSPAHLRTLLYAAPVAVETAPSGITALIVATKSGLRRLHARRWIDASESGHLARLAGLSLSPRIPSTVYRSMVLHSAQPEQLDAAFPALAQKHSGVECFASLRTGERRLRWLAGPDAAPWHRTVPALVTDLRALLATPDSAESHFLVSHCSMNEFPVYAAAPAHSLEHVPTNLVIASPALRGEPLATPADRHALGLRAAAELDALPTSPRDTAPATSAPITLTPSSTLAPAEVLVAGVGTGGAFAAIAAGRGGARTLAIDSTTYPGGIGTGAGICGYFHGAKGGLQSEIDERVQAMTTLLTGVPAGPNGWHAEAKKIVLLNAFDKAGVTFLGDVLLTGVERDDSGRVLAALGVVDGRLTRLPAAAFIDGTGDGDLAVFAGASFSTGRPGDGRTLSYSQSIFSLTTKDGRPNLRSCNFDAGWVDPTDPEDISQARLAGIAQHLQPDWTQPDRAIAVAPLLGLRQSRQIATDVEVAFPDLVARRRFDDSIGEVDTVADTHSMDYEFETDDLAFYYWTCRGFRHPLRSELPYRMLLPRGLTNVWIACRAAGIRVDAAYGLRMQREMQRLGEASGIAAALATTAHTDSRGIDFSALRDALDRSGSRPADRPELPATSESELLAPLDRGLSGVHLWHLSRDPERHRAAVTARLASPEPRVAFLAAALLAMWHDASAEPRLLAALQAREDGPAPTEHPVPGPFSQCIDLPFWLQAVVLLRHCGTALCLPALHTLAATPDLPLNVRTIVALTLERLASRLGAQADLISALDALTADAIPDPVLPPSRSLWHTLHGEPQKKLGNDRGAAVSQDHTWQLHLVIARTRKQLGLPQRTEPATFARDSRAFVRNAFASIT